MRSGSGGRTKAALRRFFLRAVYALGLYGTAFFPIPSAALRALHAERIALCTPRRRLAAVIARQEADAAAPQGPPAGHPERLLTDVPPTPVERPLWEQLDLRG
ncbi:MAG: hypothetical protein HOV87_22940 [Catenulispora sp.]|nr:hypothetical protein [Catenulispora sp.]